MAILLIHTISFNRMQVPCWLFEGKNQIALFVLLPRYDGWMGFLLQQTM